MNAEYPPAWPGRRRPPSAADGQRRPDRLDPITAPDDTELVNAVLLWTAEAASPADPRLDSRASDAEHASRRLYGSDHPRTRRAVLARSGRC